MCYGNARTYCLLEEFCINDRNRNGQNVESGDDFASSQQTMLFFLRALPVIS